MFVFSTFHLIHFIWFFFEKAVQQKLSCVKQKWSDGKPQMDAFESQMDAVEHNAV